jgi:preprotein translocase subunit SecD
MKRNIVVTLVFFLFAVEVEAAQYVSNAFAVRDEANEEILTNRDIACVKISKMGKSEAATITLLPEATRFFATYTKQNKEKPLAILVCGRQASKPIIKTAITSGKLTIGSLTTDDVKCLKNSFDTEAICRDCPVCKGP